MLGITTRVGVAALIGVFSLVVRGWAAPMSFDVAGHATITTLVAPNPGVFVSTTVFPSTVALDITDDGLVTLSGATLSWSMFANFGAIGSLTTDEVLTLPAGGLGTLVGDQILWSSDLIQGSLMGTFHCEGPLCEVLGVPPIVIQPLSVLATTIPYFLPTTTDSRSGPGC
jgi:hypothetical protein